MKDAYQREINYARISITDYCNLMCQYCRTEDDVVQVEQIGIRKIKSIIDVLDALNFKKIRFTGGEPLLSENIIELVEYTNNKENINDIGLTTNGVLLKKYADELLDNGLKRVNISLDTLDAKKFYEITKTNLLSEVLDGIAYAKKIGMLVKINVVLLNGLNDNEIKDFLTFGRLNDIQVRFIELMPIGDNQEYIAGKQQTALDFFKDVKLTKVASDSNDVSDYYIDDHGYEFGIITPMSNHFCEKCNRIRFTSDGKLRLCLHSNDDIDLNGYLEDYDKLYQLMESVIMNKPEQHHLDENKISKKGMSKIGG